MKMVKQSLERWSRVIVETCFLSRFSKKDVEAAVNLTYVTKGHLSTPRKQYNPETGVIKLSLRVPDHPWQPRQGLRKWDSKARIFTEVGDFELKHCTNHWSPCLIEKLSTLKPWLHCTNLIVHCWYLSGLPDLLPFSQIHKHRDYYVQ